jgi:hypothetical protein
MTQQSGDMGGQPEPVMAEKVGNPWMWALLRLAALALMTCSMGMPWLVEARPQSGLVSIGLLALPTIGLICLPYLAVYGLGLTLAFLSSVLPARLRKVLAALYIATLALVILIGIAIVAIGGLAQLDGTWGNWVFAAGAALGIVVEILAWGKGRQQ